MSNENQQANVKITVDNKGTEELVKLLKEKEQKKEDSLAEHKLQAYQKFNDTKFLDAQSQEELSNMLTAHINDLAQKAKGTPSGSAPLSKAQFGQKEYSLYEKPYNRETLDELQKLSAEGNQEAKDILTAILKKWAIDKRRQNTPEDSFNPNSKEALERLDLIEKDGFLTPRNKDDSEVGRLQARWRAERKAKMEEGKSND